jgi:hypothetical protein
VQEKHLLTAAPHVTSQLQRTSLLSAPCC